jgi:WD40 repeat protein
MNASGGQPKYWAFISYSHADAKWGKWLHKKLETFPVPRVLVGKETERGYKVPKRLMPIFRDREELPGSATLKDNIQEALEQSRYLVVICSPRSAASIWVNEEVLTFKAMGRSDHVLCLIVDGEPNATDKPGSGLLECFPPAVRHAVNPDRSLSQQREEPIAADARPGKDGKVDSLLKLASGLLGVGFDDLKQRDARRRRRRKALYTMAAAAFAALLAWGAWEFKAQRVRLQNAASSMADFREAAATFDSGDSGLGMAYLARALKKDPSNKPAAQRLFYELTYKNWVQSVEQVASGSGCVLSADFNSDLSKLALVTSESDNQSLLVIDVPSGQELLRLKGTAEWGPRFASLCGNNIVAVRASMPAELGIPNTVSFFDLKTGAKLKDMQVGDSAANCIIASEDGSHIFIGWGKTSPSSYWDGDRYALSGPDKSEEPVDSDPVEPKSGAIHGWKVGEEEVLITPTVWPVISLSLNESQGLLHAATSSKTKGFDTGYIQTLSTRDLSAAGDPIKVDAPVYDIQISDEGKLVLSCGDSSTRIYGKDLFTGATVLRSTIMGKGVQKVLPLGNMVGMASNTGHAKVASLGGELLIPEWGLGARFAGLNANEPLNFTLVSWAGITPIDRGGRVFVKNLSDPYNDLMPAPLEPPLWWPTQSIFSANVSQRAEKLFVVRHGPTAEEFRWDLLSVELSNRAAKNENVACGDILTGTVSKSSSGRYVACLAQADGKDTPIEILVYDAVSREEKSRIDAPADVSTVAFSADEKKIIAFSSQILSIYDLDLRKVHEFALQGKLYHEEREQLPFRLTFDVLPNSPFAAVVGVVETSEGADVYNLTLFDVTSGVKLSTAPIPGRPGALTIDPNANAFVVSWKQGKSNRCSLVSARDGAILREFPSNQSPRAFSFDGRRFLMRSFPNDFLYDTRDWSQITELIGHSRMICAYAFDSQSRFLTTGALDGTIRFWSLQNGIHIGEEIPPISQRNSKSSRTVSCLQLNQAGDRLLAGFSQWRDGEIAESYSSLSVWDTTERLATFPELQTRFLSDAWFVEGGDSVALLTGEDGGRFVSFLDISLPERELPSDVWRVAQEVSGYEVTEQISKSDELPHTLAVVDQVRDAVKGNASKADRWLEWYVSPPKDRTVSPFSGLQTSEHRRVLTEDMRMQRHLFEAFEMDPTDNLNLANLAMLTDYRIGSEAIWKVALKGSGDDKDILFRRAVRLFEDSWYEEGEIGQDSARDLTLLVRENLENDLTWSPVEQGVARNGAFFINRQGFLDLISHSGTPEIAKKAALLSLDELWQTKDEHSRQQYIEKEYSEYVKASQSKLGSHAAFACAPCAAEMRRSFWLEQSSNPLGKKLAYCWASLAPDLFSSAIVRDAGHFQSSYPEFAVQFWKFAYDRLRQATQDSPAEQSDKFMVQSGALASGIALQLIETGHQGSDAELFAREGLSCREKAGVTGWPMANSKSLVGAALLQQDKLDLAEPFVSEGAKELLSLKETIPDAARPRLTEAVNRAALLYEKKGNQELASYWRSESDKLSADPRFASTE